MPSTDMQRVPSIERSLDNTALSDYMTCPRKYLYSMVYHRRKRRVNYGQKPSLAYGTTWHAILEAHYKTGGDRAAVVEAAVGSWQQHDSPDDHRTLERALREYENYLTKWGDHDAEAANWGRTVGYPESPVVEAVTELTWSGALHPYTSKIDRIFELQGLFYVEDHKTSSAKPNFRQFDPSNQMMGYVWSAQLLAGVPIAGVRINAHAVLKTTSHFERGTIMYSQERLVEWAQNYNRWVLRLQSSMEKLAAAPESPHVVDNAFPMQLNACAGKYGMCQYADICTFDRATRDKVLASDFEIDAWDPMKSEEEGD